MQKILITGGSGMIGTQLTHLLREKGYEVAHLGRHPHEKNGVRTYQWDYSENYLEKGALEETDYIIHLAGAGVGDKRWTKARKKEMYDSRVQTARLLFDKVKETNAPVKKIISASAVGFYGRKTGLLTEDLPPGTDYLSVLCEDWEAGIKKFDELGIPHTIFRFGIVLSDKGGFVEQISKPIKLGFGTILGSGQQLISWIHADDLCKMLLKAVEEPQLTGIYNAVSPEPASNAEITKALAKKLHRPLWLPNAPAFALKLILGEMSYELLVSHNVSARKIMNAGFTFKFPTLDSALEDVVG